MAAILRKKDLLFTPVLLHSSIISRSYGASAGKDGRVRIGCSSGFWVPLDGKECLEDIAYLSGDKGNTSNISVVARDPQYYSYLKDLLMEKVVAEWFKECLEPLEDKTIYYFVT
uniref:AtuA-like ferredoxin-fold domain-containing protein n=1 Tax=Amphimedon queenslandica TaxID=400682 RepID=A0A1X7UMF3_AMPQE